MITINLPAATIKSFINVENPAISQSIEDTFDFVNAEKSNVVKSLWTDTKVLGNCINYDYYNLYLNKISKNICKNNNQLENMSVKRKPLKYFMLHLGFHDQEDISFLVPGCVRFYSKTTKSFVPIEFLKKTDLLIDYKGNSVKMVKKEELTDYNIEGQDFYSMLFSIDIKEDTVIYDNQFYLNGILTSISYYNFENCF